MIRVRMTPAQLSALECRDLDSWPVEGSWLVYELAQRDAVWAALVDAANGEDGQAEHDRGRGARESARMAARARDALTRLAEKVLRSG
jgi:hypothetical protein